jgi:hypothetical protein
MVVNSLPDQMLIVNAPGVLLLVVFLFIELLLD